MPYRPPIPGDVLSARTPTCVRYAVIQDVTDDGREMTITGSFGHDHPLSVTVRRVAVPPQVPPPGRRPSLPDALISACDDLIPLLSHPDPEVTAVSTTVTANLNGILAALTTVPSPRRSGDLLPTLPLVKRDPA